MATNTAISWTDHTINFWTGCKKVSPGCKFCYMYRDKERYGVDPTVVMKVNQSTINKVLKEAKPGQKIFTCSWSDFFIEEADQWREWAWDIIRSRPDIKWQILTKRPERILKCLPADWEEGWDNVWIGVSAEAEKEATERIGLLSIVPCKITFLSIEPLIECFDLKGICARYGFTPSWVIIGGESGNDIGKYQYRPCFLIWIQHMVNECKLMNVPVWVKQTGTFLSTQIGLKSRHGSDINEWPKDIRVQQFPLNPKLDLERKHDPILMFCPECFTVLDEGQDECIECGLVIGRDF